MAIGSSLDLPTGYLYLFFLAAIRAATNKMDPDKRSSELSTADTMTASDPEYTAANILKAKRKMLIRKLRLMLSSNSVCWARYRTETKFEKAIRNRPKPLAMPAPNPRKLDQRSHFSLLFGPAGGGPVCSLRVAQS